MAARMRGNLEQILMRVQQQVVDAREIVEIGRGDDGVRRIGHQAGANFAQEIVVDRAIKQIGDTLACAFHQQAGDLAVEHDLHHAAGLQHIGECAPSGLGVGKVMQDAAARNHVELPADCRDIVKIALLEDDVVDVAAAIGGIAQ